jgi:hypothetical protein
MADEPIVRLPILESLRQVQQTLSETRAVLEEIYARREQHDAAGGPSLDEMLHARFEAIERRLDTIEARLP